MKTAVSVFLLLALVPLVLGVCDMTEATKCANDYASGVKDLGTNTGGHCKLMQTYVSCVTKACPDTLSTVTNTLEQIMKAAGITCDLTGGGNGAGRLGGYPSLLLVTAAIFLAVFLRG